MTPYSNKPIVDGQGNVIGYYSPPNVGSSGVPNIGLNQPMYGTYRPDSVLYNYGVPQGQQPQPSIGINPVTSAPRLLGTFKGVGSAINNFGATNLGTAPVAAPGFVGPMPQGTSAVVGGNTLTGLAQGAGVGYLAGTLNPWAKNKTNSQIGGVAGGLAGAAALGGMSGVTMGATLGSIVPGIGTVIGAVGGALLGGFLGPKKPKPGASFDAGLGADASYSGLTKMSKNMDNSSADITSQELTPYLQNLKSLGVNIPAGYRVGGGYGLGQGFVYYGKGSEQETRSTAPNRIGYDIDDPAARNKAYSDMTYNLAKEFGADEATLAKIREYVPPQTQEQQAMAGGNVAAPNVAVKDLNPNMANNNWDNFMKSYNARNA